ncbi:metallophosphoesterase [Bordetella petrii]|uniref:metallophosphoesterase n=1 Tax=Bordetella petrii TaxID=94624 RepID=UPI001E4E6E72|nr:metallophosphoesterase [Bordetella petrii]MCD0503181.1 metallophosphoesterase [Bordetella petrii]
MPRLSFLLRLLALVAAAHAYVGLRLIPDLSLSPHQQWAAVAALALSCVLMPLSLVIRPFAARPWADTVAAIGLLAMGLFSSVFVLTLLRDAVLALAFSGAALASAHLPVSTVKTGSAFAVLALAAAATLLGIYNARRLARVVRVQVPIADLPAALEGFTIAQISDIHVGPTIKHGYVEQIVQAVNALQPDLVAITGDVVDGPVAQLAPHTRPLGELRARHGAFLVTGNHEYYSGASSWVAEFRRLGLQVLMNQHATLNHQGAQLVVAGVTDYSAGAFDPAQASNPVAALAGAPAGAVSVLLAHQPRSAAAAAPAGFQLQISGHTHGGQFLPWNFFVRFQQPFTAGLRRFDDMWVYTSRGTGYWGPPVRLDAPSEITLLTLVARR